MTHIHFAFLLLLLVLGSCSDDDDQGTSQQTIPTQSKITPIVSLNGLGDNGYNDKIARGVMTFANTHAIEMSLLYPSDISYAKYMVNNWIKTDGVRDSSILIVNNSYESMIDVDALNQLGKGSKILVIEGQGDFHSPHLYNLRICRYGASYLIGTMAQEFDALVLMAMPDYAIIDEARNGFLAGYEKYKHERVNSRTLYIAEDESGFANPEKAHHLMEEYVYDDFIFPLAGGSVSGVVHFLNNDYFALALMAGMDSEQSGESPRVPFSMVVHIDKLLTDYLEAWKKGDEWQHHAVFGLNEQAVEIVMNERFGYDLNIWDDRCSLEKFENYHRLYVNEAKELESDYISNIFER